VRYTSGLGERVQFWDINRPAYQNQDLDLRFFYIQMFISYRNTLTFSVIMVIILKKKCFWFNY